MGTVVSQESSSQKTTKHLLVIGDWTNSPPVEKELNSMGYEIEFAEDPSELLSQIQKRDIHVAICATARKDLEDAKFFDRLAEIESQPIVILIGDSKDADEYLTRLGADTGDVLIEPANPEDILLAIKKAIQRRQQKRHRTPSSIDRSAHCHFGSIVAKSNAMLEIFETIEKIADYNTTVLLFGESGTGKEVLARAIHSFSPRKRKSFVAINCGAIPEHLLESELFGHKKGAFTDATKDKKGLFEEAEGGTILLDEIGELPVHLQVKLLRVLQENEIRPVGGGQPIPIDVRVIAATLRDLENDVIDGRFRDDLYYRLNVIAIQVPPLRERREDIPVLIDYFIEKNKKKLNLPVHRIEQDALNALIHHDWPGNIRELENCIERATILSETDSITLESLPNSIHSEDDTENDFLLLPKDQLSIKAHVRLIEETLIRRALKKTNGNRTHAAKLLEISHRTLLYKLKEYQIVDAK